MGSGPYCRMSPFEISRNNVSYIICSYSPTYVLWHLQGVGQKVGRERVDFYGSRICRLTTEGTMPEART
ncbi:hypothetical protein ACN38_g1447 [Penicillium nordicum]|uniref:Uncharacterized protein n=1 Tax=Penicillium nordicum TaxID=229535 RepID=A0A0M9WJU2_9EURO|nr:hypothetical protein ACN38_g1447 [Penicillium nordicum]